MYWHDTEMIQWHQHYEGKAKAPLNSRLCGAWKCTIQRCSFKMDGGKCNWWIYNGYLSCQKQNKWIYHRSKRVSNTIWIDVWLRHKFDEALGQVASVIRTEQGLLRVTELQEYFQKKHPDMLIKDFDLHIIWTMKVTTMFTQQCGKSPAP
jgi:hypothetical protein